MQHRLLHCCHTEICSSFAGLLSYQQFFYQQSTGGNVNWQNIKAEIETRGTDGRGELRTGRMGLELGQENAINAPPEGSQTAASVAVTTVFTSSQTCFCRLGASLRSNRTPRLFDSQTHEINLRTRKPFCYEYHICVSEGCVFRNFFRLS